MLGRTSTTFLLNMVGFHKHTYTKYANLARGYIFFVLHDSILPPCKFCNLTNFNMFLILIRRDERF